MQVCTIVQTIVYICATMDQNFQYVQIRTGQFTDGAPFGLNEILIFCLRILQAERDFITYRQTSDILLVSSKGTAAAR